MYAFNTPSLIYMILIAALPFATILIWSFSKNNVARFTFPLHIFLPSVIAIFLISEFVVSICVPVPRSIIFGRVYSHGFWNTKHMISSLPAAYIGSMLITLFSCAALIIMFELFARMSLQRVEAHLFACKLSSYQEQISPILRRAQKRIERKNDFAARTQLYYIVSLYQCGLVQEACDLSTALLSEHASTIAKPIRVSLLLQLAQMYDDLGQKEKAIKATENGQAVLTQSKPKNARTKSWILHQQKSLNAQSAFDNQDFKTAAAIWEQMISSEHLDYNKVMLYCQLARAYHAQGMSELARGQMAQANALAPDFYSVKKASATLH